MMTNNHAAMRICYILRQKCRCPRVQLVLDYELKRDVWIAEAKTHGADPDVSIVVTARSIGKAIETLYEKVRAYK